MLRTNVQGILKDFETFGFLFESLCMRDLRVHAQVNDGGIFHYRDTSELECDLIIKLNDGRWAPVEVKLGDRHMEDAAANLSKLSKKVESLGHFKWITGCRQNNRRLLLRRFHLLTLRI